MKKSLFFILVIFFSASAFSQNSAVLAAFNFMKAGNLLKAKANIDIAITNDQTKDLAKTWFYRGNIYLKLYLGDYKQATSDPLQVAYDSYNTAIKLDPQIRNDAVNPSTPVIGLHVVSEQIYNQGIDLYNEKKYAEAIEKFEETIKLNEKLGVEDNVAAKNISLCKAQLERNRNENATEEVEVKSDENEVKMESDENNSTGLCTFRSVSFGDSPATVKSKETATFSQEADASGLHIMTYSVRVFDSEASLGYIFANDNLTRANYYIEEDFINQNNYITLYNSIKDKLTEKYGKPDTDKKVWSNDLYKDDPDDYGMAVSAGHLTYQTKFETDCTTIYIVLKGEKFDCKLVVEYQSKKYGDLEDKVKKSAEQNDY